MKRTILYGSEYMTLHEDGCIERTSVNIKPSGQWRITGAVTYNNLGHIIRRYSLKEILDHPEEICWQHKNGKQKTHLTVFDHGTYSVWCSPNHMVF